MFEILFLDEYFARVTKALLRPLRTALLIPYLKDEETAVFSNTEQVLVVMGHPELLDPALVVGCEVHLVLTIGHFEGADVPFLSADDHDSGG